MKLPIIFVTTLFLLSGCRATPNKQAATESGAAQTEEQVTSSSGYPIQYDSTPVLKSVYVTDRNGLDARQEPDPNSEILASYGYGDRLEVIEQAENYYGIRERISRRIETDASTVISNGWEKIYVSKAQTGSFDQLGLCQADLDKIVSLSENIGGEMQTTAYEQPEPLGRYLSIELIDKRLYDEKKNTAVDFLIADTTHIVKNHGEIALPCTHKVVKYTDNDSEGDSYKSYAYIGRIDSLNSYVVECSYYENWAHQLIDMTDGKTTYTIGYPHLSPDCKYMICIHENPYEGITDLELYAVEGRRIKQSVVFAGFANWMPVTDEKNGKTIFWGSDNYLYAAVNHTKTYWTPDGMYNDRHQYIRIKIVEP